MNGRAAQTARDAGAPISSAVARSLDAASHPLSQFNIEALVAGAARPRPGALAFADHHDGARHEVSFADLYQRVGACVARLRSFELSPGERVVICAPPGVQPFVALVAALSAGLEPVLAPMPLPSTRHTLALAAREIEAAALFAPAQFCGVDFEEELLTLVGSTPSVRFIGALSGTLDGAADFSAATLSSAQTPRVRLLDEWRDGDRPQIGAVNDIGGVDFCSHSALLVAALDLVRLTRKDGHAPIVSLCAPSSLPALVAGPLTALIAGAPLHFLAPFEAARFLNILDALGRVRVVAPSVLLPDLARAGLLEGEALLSVTALTQGAEPRFDGRADCPIVEIRARNGRITLG